MRILITGGAGFIGSALVRFILNHTQAQVLVVDKFSYAAHPATLKPFLSHPRFNLVKLDIIQSDQLYNIFNDYEPDAVMHLAAESHVDNAIISPDAFIQTNIIGTYQLLNVALSYYNQLDFIKQKQFRFHHISTDEVYGELLDHTAKFTESSAYAPRNPYSASKASADHLVRAWAHTYGLPILITNTCNNYGPYQFPEKLIPLVITRALTGQHLPVYGQGQQVRDWIYVDDHVRALYQVLLDGRIGHAYNIGADSQQKNIDVVEMICDMLDQLKPINSVTSDHYTSLIRFVDDRLGHDQRYAIDNKKITQTLNWQPIYSFEQGLHQTLRWYLDNMNWWQSIIDKSYLNLDLSC